MSAAPGTLILVPVSLGETPWNTYLPEEARRAAAAVRHFVVENPKAARAQLRRMEHPLPLRELELRPLPAEGSDRELDDLLAPLFAGHDLGLMSDAGCPGVADPGARLVARAHAHGLRVHPLVGPSSILLALMASGLNGQNFAFCGYLPVAPADRNARIRQIEDESKRLSRTQIFIETPYRNERMLEALLAQCQPQTRLCLAMELNCAGETILTLTIAQWRKRRPPELSRRPALFLILAD
ncbi:MAG: SAM-dependent methyltransferase [Rhodocyclaceae bacterium]|jgi:16S rRNA (cytidine1402-2'-O)-methyltransferase|nr:SAM-dependent methyltransferase [Rhodocyclaceae bacterium]